MLKINLWKENIYEMNYQAALVLETAFCKNFVLGLAKVIYFYV